MDSVQPAATSKSKSRASLSRKQPANQTLSCAECRRLKLRCDRVFPCSSCQKRGISELCPDGALPTRNKPMTSIFDKDRLYQHLSELRGRILELEKALEVAHAAISSQPHPLLSEGSFKRKTQPKSSTKSRSADQEDGQSSEDEAQDLDEALGALTMDNEGLRGRYFGRSACVTRLFRYHNDNTLTKSSEGSALVAAEVAMVYQSFPFLTIGEATNLIQERIWDHLPPLRRAQALRESYCRQVYYLTDIVPKDDWFEELFTRIYAGADPNETPLRSISESGVRIEELALIFGYFALGALVDLDLTAFNYEAEAYACLSRSALATSNIFQNATITTIESLILLAHFEAMWGETIGSGDSWLLTGLATTLATSIGIHRNAGKFGMQTADSKRRNNVYWELYTLELVDCLAHGRPSTFSSLASDIGVPTGLESKSDYHLFRYKFALECLAPLAKLVFSLRVPAYNSIVELDRKIRKFCSDVNFGAPGKTTDFTGMDETEAMKFYYKLVLRETTCLYLHRTFFVRSITMNPLDPQHTKHGLSVSGAYDSAMTLVQTACGIYKLFPAVAARALACWNHTLCAAFVLGTITTRSPTSRLAPLAAKRLQDMSKLYCQASIYGGRAAADAPIVRRMLDNCMKITQAYATAPYIDGLVRASAMTEQDNDGDDDLGLVGGHTRLIREPSVLPISSPHSNPSPGITDSGSISDSGVLFTNDSVNTFLYTSQGPKYGPRSLDQGEHLSLTVPSGNSELSPKSADVIAIQQEGLTVAMAENVELNQYRGISEYNYPLGLTSLNHGHSNGTNIVNSTNRSGVQQGEYVPMELSLPGPQSWNFRDDWLGHIGMLDTMAPTDDIGHAL